MAMLTNDWEIALKDEFNLVEIVNFMLLGFIIANAMSFISQQIPYNRLGHKEHRYQGFSDNSNYLGMRAVFLTTFYFVQHLRNELSLPKLVLIFGFCSIITLATQSKTSMLLLILFSLIFIVLLLKKDFKKNVKWVGLLILVGIIISFIFNDLILKIFARFIPDKNNIFNSLLTGRDEIWLMYFNEWSKSPFTILFGNGLLTQEVFIPSQNIARTSHSLYLFLLYRFGIIGCTAIGFGIFYLIKSITKHKVKFFTSLPLLWFLLVSLVDNTFLCFNITYLPIALLIMFNSNNNQEKDKKKTNK